MDPVALEIGKLQIRWYGVFMAIGFLAGFLLVQYRAEKKGFTKEQTADLLFWALIGGLVGSRLLYVFQNWDRFSQNLLEVLKIYHGGLVFYGGLAGAVLIIVALSLKHRWSLRQVGDLLAPALPLGQAFGRIGCLINGCCFGKPWSGIFSITYPPHSEVCFVQHHKGFIATENAACLPVVPIQLLLAIMGATICAMLLVLDKRLQKPGLLFPVYLIFYAAGRFILEFGRGDYLNTIGPFTPAQAVCLVLLPAGLLWFILEQKLGHHVRDH